jgi:hypothetical protein
MVAIEVDPSNKQIAKIFSDNEMEVVGLLVVVD